jgi:hypothetical protein
MRLAKPRITFLLVIIDCDFLSGRREGKNQLESIVLPDYRSCCPHIFLSSLRTVANIEHSPMLARGRGRALRSSGQSESPTEGNVGVMVVPRGVGAFRQLSDVHCPQHPTFVGP